MAIQWDGFFREVRHLRADAEPPGGAGGWPEAPERAMLLVSSPGPKVGRHPDGPRRLVVSAMGSLSQKEAEQRTTGLCHLFWFCILRSPKGNPKVCHVFWGCLFRGNARKAPVL